MGHASKTYYRKDKEKMRGAFVDERLDLNSESCLEKLDVKGGKIYKERPSKCPECKSVDICKLEIYGAREGALFWECQECRHKYLMFSVKDTLAYLFNTSQVWWNPKDFEDFRINRG